MVKKESLKIVLFILVSLILISTIIATSFVIIDNLDLIGFGSQKHPPHVFYLTYPDDAYPYEVIYSNGSIIGTPLVSVNIALQYSGELVEGSKVNVSASGLAYPEGRKIIPNISVPTNETFQHFAILSFTGATIYNQSEKVVFNSPNGEFPVNLQEDRDRLTFPKWNDSDPWPFYQTIKWDIQGDYYPILTIPFENGTRIEFRYTDKIIHVGGSEVARQERFDEVTTWLTIAVLLFTIIVSIESLQRLIPKCISDLFPAEKDPTADKPKEPK